MINIYSKLSSVYLGDISSEELEKILSNPENISQKDLACFVCEIMDKGIIPTNYFLTKTK